MVEGITSTENITRGFTGMPTVSVIIPTYNRAHLIKAAISSVQRQTIRPCELIIIDDESTDETEGVLQSLESPIPIIYHRQHNQGPAKARNVGVALARGEWIAFLDSDDEWHSEKLEAQLQVAREHSNVPFIYSDLIYIGRAGEPLHPRKSMGPLDRLYFEYPPYPSTVLLNRRVFHELGGFKPELHFGEDIELFSRIAARYPVWCVRRPLVRYRCHEGQTTRDLKTRMKSWAILLDSFIDLVGNDRGKQTIVHKLACRVYSDLGNLLMSDGQHAMARKYFLKAFRYRWSKWKNLRRWALAGARSLGLFRFAHQKGQSDESVENVLPAPSLGFLSCPACGSYRAQFPIVGTHKEHSPVFQGSYLVYHCKHCQTEFALPRLPAPAEWYTAKHEYYGWRWEFDLLLTHLAQDQQLRPNDRARTILEIGCGEGILLERLASEGEAWGIETNTAAAVIAASKGMRVYDQDLSNFRARYPDARFDIIVFFQVLEHLPHPWEFLSDLKALLSSPGMIAFSVPNPDRYAVSLERERWDYPPHHLTRFSKQGLSLLLERGGFEVVCMIDRPTNEMDVREACHLLYKNVLVPRRVRQVLKLPLRIALTPIAKMRVARSTGQDLYVVARPRIQGEGNEACLACSSGWLEGPTLRKEGG